VTLRLEIDGCAVDAPEGNAIFALHPYPIPIDHPVRGRECRDGEHPMAKTALENAMSFRRRFTDYVAYPAFTPAF